MITIKQGIEGVYPAYNDSFIIFESDISPEYADIDILSVSSITEPFRVYPDDSGEFVFNLKEVSKVIFNSNDFSSPDSDPNFWAKRNPNILKNLVFRITATSLSTSESLNLSYRFSKTVKQSGDTNLGGYLRYPSERGIDYSLKYWSGFPFSIGFLQIGSVSDITVKNSNNGMSSTPFDIANSLSEFEDLSLYTLDLFIDRGTDNWNTSNVLPINKGLNNLEIYEDDELRANLDLLMETPKEGVYLRWYNNDGGVSYHLFDPYYAINTKVKTEEILYRSNFANVGDNRLGETTSSKRSEGSKILTSTVEKEYIPHLDSLYVSPKVEVWSSNLPFTSGVWTPVTVDSSVSHESKLNRADYTVRISPPKDITLSL